MNEVTRKSCYNLAGRAAATGAYAAERAQYNECVQELSEQAISHAKRAARAMRHDNDITTATIHTTLAAAYADACRYMVGAPANIDPIRL